MHNQTVAVLGAGAVGLATAVAAQEAGCSVTVYTDRPLEQTTSAKAAASFKPVDVAYNDLAHTMLIASWEGFSRLVNDFPTDDHGVRMHTHWEAFSVPRPLPAYKDVVDSFRQMRAPEVPGGYPFAWQYRTFFIDMSVYLGWMVSRLAGRGGRVVYLDAPLASLADAAQLPAPVIYNCTGTGAGALCRDERLRPIKGQVLVTDPIPGMDWSISADGFYVYPRRYDTILGGTTQFDDNSDHVDQSIERQLIERNRRILPGLNASAIRGRYAGTRPFREGSIRLETEDIYGKRFVHSYGHGGAGVTLSWGAAEMALALEG
ncbi:MAG: FAD-dependent oxidoreductase [Actinomycetota bacterium]